MSLLLALGIVAILILSGFLWGSIEVKISSIKSRIFWKS